MNKKTLAELILTGTLLMAPQTISNTSGSLDAEGYDHIESRILSPLEKARLEVYGEYQQALGTDFFEFYRLIYSDKRDVSNPISLENLEGKTEEELKKGLILKDELESKYALLYRQSNLDTLDTKWGKIINGYSTIPEGTYRVWDHEALDIFTEEGNEVLSPFNGIVVASGDQWEGTFEKREISTWNNKGLTPRAGNAMIIYNPVDKGYLLIAHFKEGLTVKTGDIISKGQIVGYVGHSGSASIKGHGEHIHAVYKLRDKNNYLSPIDFSDKIK